MSLGSYKIKDTDIASKGVVAAPDKLTGSAEENKKIFDRLIRETVKGDFNGLIDALTAAGVEHMALLPENAAGFKYIRLNSDKVLEVSTDGKAWQATGSSGHLIIGPDGQALPQRSRMQFTNGTVKDQNGVTLVTGVKGDKGDKGETGAQGPKGDTGARGPVGQAIIPSVDQDTGLMSFSLGGSGRGSVARVCQGPAGPAGRSRPRRSYRTSRRAGLARRAGYSGPKRCHRRNRRNGSHGRDRCAGPKG